MLGAFTRLGRAGRRRRHRHHGGPSPRRRRPSTLPPGASTSSSSTPTPATATPWSTPTRPRAPAWPSGTCSTSATAPSGTSPGPRSPSPAQRRAARLARRRSTEAGRPVPPPLRGDWSAESGYAAGLAPRRRARLHRGVRRQRPDGARPAARPARAGPAGARATSASSASTTSPTPASFLPPLTTVHQDFAEVGRRCVEGVLRQIRDGPRRARHRPGPHPPGAPRQHGTARQLSRTLSATVQ